MPSNTDPQVIRLLKEYRQSLIERENNQTERLAREWLKIENSLQDEMLLLAQQIADEKAKGSVITEQLLFRQSRYQKLNSQMKTEILSFAKNEATEDISSEQLEYGKLGIDSASQAIKLSYPFGKAFDRLPVSQVETMVGLLGDGTPLYRLLKEAYPESLDSVINTLLLNTAKGIPPSKTAYDMSRSMGVGLERISLIARTEQLRVSRLSSSQQYRQSGLDGYMRRVATKDDRTCMACLLLDGQIILLGQELDDHPRGRCVAVFQIKGVPVIQWEKGKQWFEKQDESLQRQMMGNQKYEMWQEGLFQLTDLAKIQENETWGNSPRVASVQELANG